MTPMDLHKDLLRVVYPCTRCLSFGFEGPAGNPSYFKFPATIGATGPAPLLFVGINPRITPDNRDLHDRLMAGKLAFARLALNRDGEAPYISPGCRERHYHWHMRVVQSLFGLDAKFEDHAAVTELFLCATPKAKHLMPIIADSPCANLYFERVFLKVRPALVLPVFPDVLNYFQRLARAGNQNGFLLALGGHTACVVHIPH